MVIFSDVTSSQAILRWVQIISYELEDIEPV